MILFILVIVPLIIYCTWIFFKKSPIGKKSYILIYNTVALLLISILSIYFGYNAYNKVIKLRNQNDEVKYIADQYFFETIVRIHRAGEGAPFTGLKPAGLDHGPVVPVAEEAVETGSADKLITFLTDSLKSEIEKKFAKVMELKKQENRLCKHVK